MTLAVNPNAQVLLRLCTPRSAVERDFLTQHAKLVAAEKETARLEALLDGELKEPKRLHEQRLALKKAFAEVLHLPNPMGGPPRGPNAEPLSAAEKKLDRDPTRGSR